jgi:uncharacterized integral membrane protein
MTDQPHDPPAHGTTYGRQKSKWNKSMTPQGGHDGPSPRIIVAAIAALVLLIFILRNGHSTTINFLFFSWDTTVRWSLFIAVLLGVGLDRLVIWGLARRKSHEDQANTDDSTGDDHS